VVVLRVVIVQVKLQELETVLQQLLLKETQVELVTTFLVLVVMFLAVVEEQQQQVEMLLLQQQVLVEQGHLTQF
tara:strand:+ start:178 stop:399 length:222 start_codon:yes stop_codon:yes gene_type:complete